MAFVLCLPRTPASILWMRCVFRCYLNICLLQEICSLFQDNTENWWDCFLLPLNYKKAVQVDPFWWCVYWYLWNYNIYKKRLKGGSVRQFYCELKAINPIIIIAFTFVIYIVSVLQIKTCLFYMVENINMSRSKMLENNTASVRESKFNNGLKKTKIWLTSLILH